MDGLRFVAILAVVLYHTAAQVSSKSNRVWIPEHWVPPFDGISFNGNRGVELFFVLSGFILGRPFARQMLQGGKKVSLGSYYLRRLTRLEPPYVFSLLLFAMALFIYAHMPILELLKHFLASALYLHGLIYRQVSAINGVAWTLEIEVQFYLLVPLLVAFYQLRNPALRRSALLLAILFFSFFEQWFVGQNLWSQPIGILYDTVILYLQFFLSGLLLSDLYLTSFVDWVPTLGWDLASLIGWVGLFFGEGPWVLLAMPFLICFVFIGAFKGVYFPRFFRVRTTALIGGMCYSIYLWHFFIISLVFKASRRLLFGNHYLPNLVLQSVLLWVPVLVLSAIFFLLVERPCMDPDWPRALIARLKAIGIARSA